MGHQEHRERQRTILEATLAVLRADERVLGVSAGGSYAAGRTDAFSDLDLRCYLSTEERDGLTELYEKAGTLAPLLCRLWLYDQHALYLFGNGVRLDLDLLPPSRVATDGPAMALHDPRGVLTERAASEIPPTPPPDPLNNLPDAATVVDWYFWMFRQAYCWAHRAGQGDHRWYDKLAGAHDSLRQVREGLVNLRLWTLDTGDYHIGRADPVFADSLSQTYPRFETAETLTATRRLVDAFERVAPAYCAKAGIEFPAGKLTLLRGMLDGFDAAGNPPTVTQQ